MNLSNLAPAKGATREGKRLGRGVGSGKGGHSSSRGNKGQKSRTGNHAMPSWFEGGQMPLQRRVPKFGFKNPFRKEYRIVSLAQIASLVASGRLDASTEIDVEQLRSAGLLRGSDRIKVLGDGEPGASLRISAHGFSRSARAKIEAAGGSATVQES